MSTPPTIIAVVVKMNPMTNTYQLSRLIFGNATSLAPIISGSTKLPSIAGHRGNQHEEHHVDAVHGEQLVVGVGRHEIARGRRQLDPDPRGEEAAQHEGDGDEDQVQDPDPLVILRQQPRSDSGLVVQVIPRRRRGGGRW